MEQCRRGGLLIVLEGGDGAGKSTQMALLAERLADSGHRVSTLHFPRVEDSVYGELIADYLRGDFGRLDSIPPKLVALLYAGDRQGAQAQIRAWLEQGRIVILDRYYASNLAYQGAKVADPVERAELIRWMLRLELAHFSVHPADLTLYLHVPNRFSQRVLAQRVEQGDRRAYLRGESDIHEASANFQQQVRDIFMGLHEYIPHYCVLDCGDDQGDMLAPSGVHALVWAMIEPLLHR